MIKSKDMILVTLAGGNGSCSFFANKTKDALFGKLGHDVHAVNFGNSQLCERACLNHFQRAAYRFLGGLKDKYYVAVERTGLLAISDNSRKTEEIGHVPIMSAGVHTAGVFGGEIKAGIFLNLKSVHICAESDAIFCGRWCPENKDEPACNLAHFIRLQGEDNAFDICARFGQIVPNFRNAVQRAAVLNQR